jgi:hypothetical protein
MLKGVIDNLFLSYELSTNNVDENASEEEKFLGTFARTFLSRQFVEQNLSAIFLLLCAGPSQAAVSAAYHSVLTLNIRLRMISSAVKIGLNKHTKLAAQWPPLSDLVTARAANRNNLAHLMSCHTPLKAEQRATGYRQQYTTHWRRIGNSTFRRCCCLEMVSSQ